MKRVKLLILIFLLALLPISNAIKLNYDNPVINRTWVSALDWMDKNLPQDAFILSWWDEGDYFMTLIHRRVLMDASNQGAERPYWFAKAMLSQDENEAYSILTKFSDKPTYLCLNSKMLNFLPIWGKIVNWDFKNRKFIEVDKVKLSGSVFARLYFENGEGLSNFKQVFKTEKKGETRIVVYELLQKEEECKR